MEKILKRILFAIPILVLSFTISIKSVSAGTLRSSNGTFQTLDIWSSNTIPANYKELLHIDRNNQTLYFLIGSSVSLNYNYIIYKSKTTNDYYIFIFYDNSDNIDNINYDTSNNYFENYNCIPYTSSCNTGTHGFTYFYITDDNLSYYQCRDYFNNLGFNLSNNYACQLTTNFQDSNNFLYRISPGESYTTSGLTTLINDLNTNYEIISMKENSKFYIDSTQVYPEPEEPEPEEPEPEPPVIDENLDKIFVPNYKKGQCIEILDKDTLRVFENENTNNYIDYFINSHYISKEGQTEVDYIKTCSTREFTSIGYYRNDFPEILFITGSLCLFSIGFVFILFKRFRKR